MNTSRTKPKALDSDISRLFAKQGQTSSPDDLDKRILEAADFAVRGVTGDLSQPPVIKRRSSLLAIGLAVIVVTLFYPLVKSFLDLPSVVQDSSRLFPIE